ncbi:restriction endonuclease subunit S [Streptomyces griseoluteus]|uniref:restriction endonuclease subunit S n=1 Tax=Streptomyces griseoluteus TaxID=29306 RepID=UPI0036C7CD5E
MSELVLGDSLELLVDNRGKNPPFVPSGIPVLSAKAIKNSKIAFKEARYISRETYQQWMPKPLRRDDVILTSEAPLGEVALVTGDEPLAIAQRLYALRGKSGVLDSRYLYYALQSDSVQADLQNRASGTTVSGIRQPELLKVRIPNPGYEKQKVIAAVLGALDDKIAISERIATTADTLAVALFHRAMWSYPAGFTERPLSTTAEFVNGRAFTKGATGTGRMVVRIAEINSGPGASTVYNGIDVPERHLAKPGDVLFAWSGSLTVARWFRPEAIINQHIFKCVPKNGYPQWLISHLVHGKIDEFRAIAADKATTMGHIQRKHLDEVVPVPDRDVLRILNAEIGPLWDRALLAEQENLTLANLRDTLLPQLMSGRLRVKDAEKIVEDHT